MKNSYRKIKNFLENASTTAGLTWLYFLHIYVSRVYAWVLKKRSISHSEKREMSFYSIMNNTLNSLHAG